MSIPQQKNKQLMEFMEKLKPVQLEKFTKEKHHIDFIQKLQPLAAELKTKKVKRK